MIVTELQADTVRKPREQPKDDNRELVHSVDFDSGSALALDGPAVTLCFTQSVACERWHHVRMH